MAVECTADNLAELSKCFSGLGPHQADAVKIYLLAVAAGVNPDPETLVESAKCLTGLSQKQSNAIQSYLLCQIANGGGGSCAALSGDSPPDGLVTPGFIGQLYNQNGGEAFFYSTGLTSADWVEISGGAPVGITWGPDPTFLSDSSFRLTLGAAETSVIFNGIVGMDSFDLLNNGVIESFSFPDLLSVSAIIEFNNDGSLISVSLPVLQTITNLILDLVPALTTFSAPALQTLTDTFTLRGTLVTSLSFPVWSSGPINVNVNQNALLTSFAAPSIIYLDGGNIDFSDCALDAASVNGILARCVASGLTASSINLSGGTNAAPSGQGVADVVTLTGNGCIVVTN